MRGANVWAIEPRRVQPKPYSGKKETMAMDWLRRVFVLLLLVSTWTASLPSMAYPAKAQAPDGPSGSSGIHVVEAGQTLSMIARQYGTDVKTLLH